MIFKPVDEISLRHLFSTPHAQQILKLSYLGPVLSSAGVIESSPDCMILDKRSHPYKQRRCEFKFEPSGKEDFAQNGRFDVAVVWSLPSGRSKDQLLAELLRQNGCSELIVLGDFKAFQELLPYTIENLSKLASSDLESVIRIARRRKLPSVFALYMAARLYPENFQMDRMVEFLSSRFPSVKKMQPRGRANVVSAAIQTKPSLLTLMYRNSYRWTSDIDSVSAAAELAKTIEANFGQRVPSDDDLNAIR